MATRTIKIPENCKPVLEVRIGNGFLRLPAGRSVTVEEHIAAAIEDAIRALEETTTPEPVESEEEKITRIATEIAKKTTGDAFDEYHKLIDLSEFELVDGTAVEVTTALNVTKLSNMVLSDLDSPISVFFSYDDTDYTVSVNSCQDTKLVFLTPITSSGTVTGFLTLSLYDNGAGANGKVYALLKATSLSAGE